MIKSILLTISLVVFGSLQAQVRGVIEVGERDAKVAVAEVDLERKEIHELFFQRTYALEDLEKIKKDTALYSPDQWLCIGACPDFQCKTIAEEEKQRINFDNAVLISRVPRERLVVLNSFDIITEIDGKLEVQKGAAISDSFKAKLKQEGVVVVAPGTRGSAAGIATIATGKTTFTKKELGDAIEVHRTLKEEQMKRFAKPEEVVLSLVSLHSVMDSLEIEQMTYCYAYGNSEGLLVDSTYWS